MRKKLAICVPVWNCLAYTKGFINSIRTSYPFDLIVHANGCSDGTMEWLSDANNFNHIKNLENVRVSFSETNLGCPRGANKTWIKAYETPDITHIIYANNDIILRAETIDNLVWGWDNRMPKIKLLSGTGFHVETYGDELKTMKAFHGFNINPLRYEFGSTYCLFIWDKRAIEDVGVLDENYEFAYFDDNDHAETILKRGYTLAKFSGSPFFHFGSVTMKKNGIDNTETFARNKDYYLKKHGVDDVLSDRRYPDAVKMVQDYNVNYEGVSL